MQRFHPLILSLVLGSLAVAGCGADNADTPKEQYIAAMMKEHRGDSPTGNDVAWLDPTSPVSVTEVEYGNVGGTALSGYLARPEGADSTIPGMVVIHEWWGLNDNIRAISRRLAGEGYAALAIDMFENNVAPTVDSARALISVALDHPERVLDNLGKAIAYLKTHGSTKIGVIGWCFGGGWSLQTALTYPEDIDAVVMYYGQLVTDPDRLSALDMPVLAFFGGKDGSIPAERIRRFGTLLDSLGVEHELHVYPDATHAFANPSGQRYNSEAATDAWSKTAAFLARHLKGEEG